MKLANVIGWCGIVKFEHRDLWIPVVDLGVCKLEFGICDAKMNFRLQTHVAEVCDGYIYDYRMNKWSAVTHGNVFCGCDRLHLRWRNANCNFNMFDLKLTKRFSKLHAGIGNCNRRSLRNIILRSWTREFRGIDIPTFKIGRRQADRSQALNIDIWKKSIAKYTSKLTNPSLKRHPLMLQIISCCRSHTISYLQQASQG